MSQHISVDAKRVTTCRDHRAVRNGVTVNWRAVARNKARTGPVFVLRTDGSGVLFFRDGPTVRQRSWKSVSLIH